MPQYYDKSGSHQSAMEERIHAEYIWKQDLEGLTGNLETAINVFVDDVNKQMQESLRKRAELNRVAEVGKRQVDERLARLEAASFELLTAAFAQVKFERGEYEEELGKRRQEANRLLIPSPAIQPISALPPSRETPKASEAVERDNRPTSSRLMAPLPQKDISIGQSSANGKFQGWEGFIPKDPDACVEDPLLKEFGGVERAVTSAINVLLSGTHLEVPKKLPDFGADEAQATTEETKSKVTPEGSPTDDAIDNASEGVSADRPIIIGGSSQSVDDSTKTAMPMSD